MRGRIGPGASAVPKAFDVPIEVDDALLKGKLQDAYASITQGDAAELVALEDKVAPTIFPE